MGITCLPVAMFVQAFSHGSKDMYADEMEYNINTIFSLVNAVSHALLETFNRIVKLVKLSMCKT